MSRRSRIFAVVMAVAWGVGGEARAQIDTDLERDVEVDQVDEVEVDGDVDVDVDVEPPTDAVDEVEPADPEEGAPTPPAASEPLVADAEDAEEDPRVRAERRAVAHQTAIEQAEPRPPELEADEPEEPAWGRHIEVGADVAFVSRPFHQGKVDSAISYDHAIAWGLHAHFNVLPWLRVTPYFLDVHHGLNIPQGALVAPTGEGGPTGSQSIEPDWLVSDAKVTTYVFGLKIQPTYNFTDRLRAWATVGFGWGRFGFPEMAVSTDPGVDPNNPPEDSDAIFVIRQRKSVFVEFPIGLGISYDLIDRWLTIEFESTAAPITGQSGNAHETFQAVDVDGNIRDVGPFGAVQASFVQALGLSLIL